MTSNEKKVEIGNLTLYYSYDTIVAFSHPKTGLVVSENIWSVTTAKHITHIDGGLKNRRLPHDLFQTRLEEIFAKENIRI